MSHALPTATVIGAAAGRLQTQRLLRAGGNAMGYMKRAEARFVKEWATIRPVMMEFRYDFTVTLWE
jgi:hypothetical protein